MTDLRDAARQALAYMESIGQQDMYPEEWAIAEDLRAALEQPEQPLAWLESPYGSIRMNTTMRFQFPPQSLKWKIPLYLHPPRREWRSLNEEEIWRAIKSCGTAYGLEVNSIARAIEAALRSKNHE